MPRRIRCGSGLQDLVRPPQLPHLTFELDDPLRLRRGRARTGASIDLDLLHPPPATSPA